MLKYVKDSAELLTFDIVRYRDNVTRIFAFLELNFKIGENDPTVHTKFSSMIAAFEHGENDGFTMEHCFRVSRYSLEEHMYTSSEKTAEWQSFDEESLVDYLNDVEMLVRKKYEERGEV